MIDYNCTLTLPDIQCSTPTIQIPIRQVGVQNIEVPFVLESKYGGFHSMFANVSMKTNLNKEIKGISMSRLLLTLKPYLDLPLKHKLIRKILVELQENIGSTDSFIKFDFRFPMKKKSPKTDFVFPLFYKCSFEGQLHGKDNFKFFQGVTIQYASYCPCSAELCKDLEGKESKGFPHNQRSFSNIIIETVDPHYVWLEDIIETVEGTIKTLPYPIIKREDEQEIARIAADNPLFVEDAIRAISFVLDNDGRIHDWIVRCVHEESIHTSEAIAINFKGVKDGFTERFFM